MWRTARISLFTVLVLMLLGAAGDLVVGGWIYLPTHTQILNIQAGSANLGPGAMGYCVVGDNTSGFCTNDTSDKAGIGFYVPTCWDGQSDMQLILLGGGEAGDPIANGEAFQWQLTYRVIDVPGGAVIGGDASVVATTTYTQTGGDAADGEAFTLPIIIDHDHADYPLVAGKSFTGIISLGAGDTYSGKSVVAGIVLVYQANILCTGA